MVSLDPEYTLYPSLGRGWRCLYSGEELRLASNLPNLTQVYYSHHPCEKIPDGKVFVKSG